MPKHSSHGHIDGSIRKSLGSSSVTQPEPQSQSSRHHSLHLIASQPQPCHGEYIVSLVRIFDKREAFIARVL